MMGKQDVRKDKETIELRSPRQLGTYIHATRPSAWITLCAIAVLLFGGLIWGFFGKIEWALDLNAFSNHGECICWVEFDEIWMVEEGMKALSSYSVGEVEKISSHAEDYENIYDTVGSLYIRNFGIEENSEYYRVYLDIDDIPKGIIKTKIIIASVRPIEFLLNQGDVL